MREKGMPSFAAAFNTAPAPPPSVPGTSLHAADAPAGKITSARAMHPGQETYSPSAAPAASGQLAQFPSVPPASAATPGIPAPDPHSPTVPQQPTSPCAPLPGRPPVPLSPPLMPPAEPLSGKPPSEHDAGTGVPVDAAVPADADGSGETGNGGGSNNEKEHIAASLLEILAQPDSAINPHVRSMAMDSLQALLSEIGTKNFLRMLARRLCLMERPPASLLRTLLAGNDREIVHTLLLDARMPESLLVEIAEQSGLDVLNVLARRRRLSTAVCNALLKRNEPEIMLELLRNRNAVIEEHGYWVVVRRARDEHGLHAPLVTREDLPAAVAFDLFWLLPPMQRRFVISRFVSDSDMLDRILKIVKPAAAGLDVADRAMHIETMIAMICDGDGDAAARRLSRLTGLHADACRRIVSDTSGEALTITFKALGLQRRVFTDVIERIRNAPASPLDGRRDTEELRILFDTLSTNKSWVMLIYWDWSARGIGPYSDRDTVPVQPHGFAMPAENESAFAEAEKKEPAPEVENKAEEDASVTGPAMPEKEVSEELQAERSTEARKELPEDTGEEKRKIAETKEEAKRPEEKSKTEEKTPPFASEGVSDIEEELPDDPLARIDALLRQLQKAARGSGRSRKEEEPEGKVA